MAAEGGQEAAKEASGGGGGGGIAAKLPMILSLLNVLLTIGLGAFVFSTFQKEKTKPQVEDISLGDKEAEGDHGKSEDKGGHGGGDAHGGKAGKPNAKKRADFGKMIPLEQFTVNLSTPGAINPRFVRVSISLEVPNEEAEAEVQAKMPQVRNSVIDLFNSKRPSDLATVEGRNYLKEEIRNALNAFLVNGKVRGVFFTSFSISS
jgi:flagellar FliL protein